MKNSRQKISVAILMLIIAAIITVITCYFGGVFNNKIVPVDNLVNNNSIAAADADISDVSKEPEIPSVTFLAAGDNLIHGAIYLQAQQRAEGTDEEYSFDYIYKNITYFLNQYDINFINQETLVNDQLPASTYPCFSTPAELGEAAYNAGFRVFGQSNNHIYDKGAEGISATRSFWNSMPEDVVVFGLYENEQDYDNIQTNTINGIKFAYLAYTQYTNGLPTPLDAQAHIIYTSQEDIIEQQITLANQIADVVVVSVHWGIEDSHEVTAEQKTLAQKMCNWGTDVIIGTHPHVIQPIEWLTSETGQKTLCAYSLGNFVSAQSRPDEMIEYMLTFKVDKLSDTQVDINNVKVYPVVNHYDYNYANIQVYLLQDYTEELANSHGVRTEYPQFNLQYINDVVGTYVPQEFLA